MFDKELHKNESLEFHNQGFFDIILGWDDFQEGKWMEDIDLCAFFRKRNGETGGVFNNTYNHNKVTEGSLSESPFIFLFGEERINPKYKCEDIIRVANIDEMGEDLQKRLREGKKILDGLVQYKFSPKSKQEMLDTFKFLYEEKY